MRYISGASASVTGRACMARIAILSEFQYDQKVVTRPIAAKRRMNALLPVDGRWRPSRAARPRSARRGRRFEAVVMTVHVSSNVGTGRGVPRSGQQTYDSRP